MKHGLLTLDTTQMAVYDTGQMWIPRIYQSNCGVHVLLEVYDIGRGTKLRYASASESDYYGRRFGLHSLLKA